jgi:recombination protein RecA
VASDKKGKAERKAILEMTVAALQDRWGVRSIHRWRQGQTDAIPHVPTGFSPLDEALGIGGLPRGRISEIIGVPTSGMATIALKIVANAQKQVREGFTDEGFTDEGLQATPGPPTSIYIDLGRTFDPDYATRCGLDLSQLVLVRPYDTRQALAILQDFTQNAGATGEGIGVLAFDAPFSLLAESQPAEAFSATLGRLLAPLGRSGCVLLFLTSLQVKPNSKQVKPNSKPGSRPRALESSLADYPSNSILPHYATVRLFIQRERWIYKDRDIHGYQAQVIVIKNKLGPAGKQVSIAITN